MCIQTAFYSQHPAQFAAECRGPHSLLFLFAASNAVILQTCGQIVLKNVLRPSFHLYPSIFQVRIQLISNELTRFQAHNEWAKS